MDYAQFADWALKALLAGGLFIMIQEMRRARGSIESLNVNVARVIEKVSGHDKEIEKHNGRLNVLEKKGKR